MPIIGCMQVLFCDGQRPACACCRLEGTRITLPDTSGTSCGIHTLLAVSGSSTPPIDFSGAATFCTRTRSSSGMRRLDMSEPARTVPLVGLHCFLQIYAPVEGALVRSHLKAGEGCACACPWTSCKQLACSARHNADPASSHIHRGHQQPLYRAQQHRSVPRHQLPICK